MSVYAIASGTPFAEALARGLLERAGNDPLRLTEYTVLLPSRRAGRALAGAFLRLSDGKAALLPRFHAIGDVDADELSLVAAEESLEIPPAIPRLERQLLLAQAVQRAGMAQSFDQAVSLARDLGRFLDETQTERLDFAALGALVPEDFSGHWQKTLTFLKIITEHWPAILAERGRIDYAARRNALLEAQAAAWRKNPPQGFVVAVGDPLTVTVPAAAALLTLVAELPQGALVLPGLDAALDDASWAALGEEHPQYFLKKLVGENRKAVPEWAEAKPSPRAKLLSEALRPAETTEAWRALTPADIPGAALENFTRIDCETPQEEADVIAFVMREALETPGRTCALVTPDRRLARRVSLSLKRWGIDVDDSGGQPLTETNVGAWLMLVAEMAGENLAPVALLSFLKHPYFAAGTAPQETRAMVQMLDAQALRGPRPAPGFAGLRDVAHETLLPWLARLEEMTREFVTLMASGEEKPFMHYLSAHLRAAQTLATTVEKEGEKLLWQGEAGEAAAQFLTELAASAKDVPDLVPAHYLALVGSLLKGQTVRTRYGTHPRLSILGQIESRLSGADKIILGGLNEGTWPGQAPHDPWMSRPMRKKFGLPSPEAAIGLAAHDFAQLAALPDVALTRAKKIDGTPTVPARWLLRLETVLKAVGRDWPVRDAALYRQWLKDIDTPAAIASAPRPAPAPPAAARPRQLSVTQVEAWMRDPYQIYARHVLGLKKLDPIDADPGGAERGTFIHAALERFIKAYPAALPEDAVEKLLGLGRAALTEMRIPPEVEAFWWPRFERIAAEFVAQEREWRAEAAPFLTEASGRFMFETAAGPFALTGKADRIDKLKTGDYALIDYKSGAMPEASAVRAGLSPQLPLEALMLEGKGFEGIAGRAGKLVYWRVTGGGREPVERRVLGDIAELVEEAGQGLRALVEKFDDPETPYLSQPVADAKPRYSDYDHLARVKEWSVAGEDGGES